MKRQKVQSSQLDNLYLASPCSIPWETMEGDARKRSCGGCSRDVFNISDMSRKHAEAFLEENGANHCMIFYRRTDGTIITDDCPVALRKIRDRLRLVAQVAAGIVAFVVALPVALAQSVNTGSTKPLQVQFSSKPTTPVHDDRAGGPRMINPNAEPIRALPGEPVLQVNTYATTKDPAKTDPKVKKQQHPPNKNLDAKASDFYSKAKDAQTKGKIELADFYFDKALAAFDQQKGGDKKFRQLIEEQKKQLQNSKPK